MGVKKLRCFVLDPDGAEVLLRVHLAPQHVSGITLRGALEGFERVDEVGRDLWTMQDFEGIESTTRIVRMSLRPGISFEVLFHQRQLTGTSSLVIIPACAPLCLHLKVSK